MLAENTALFAGGTLSEEAKMLIFRQLPKHTMTVKKQPEKPLAKRKSTIIFSRNIVRKEGADFDYSIHI